jgi:Tfp pilus assembly protein PilP
MQRLVRTLALGAAMVALGCGEDEAPPPPQRPVAAAPTPAAQSGAVPGSKNQLAEKLRVEDRVTCQVPDKPSDPAAKCDPKAPSCADNLHCLQLAQGSYCEPCPERDGIRHSFKERDFVAAQNRDPFESFLLQGSLGPPPPHLDQSTCRRNQLVASGTGYAELKLVGIVATGTQRKALMIIGREGHIIKRGDCVGKEKAVVKDIGTGYVTFQLDVEAALANQRAPQEVSVQLNPRQLAVNVPSDLPAAAPATTITPVVPPSAVPQRGAQPPAPGATPGSAAPPPVEAPPATPRKS